MISLQGLSAEQLEKLAKQATLVASDLRQREPSYRLALLNGIRDISYNTVRYGNVSSYAGEANITLDDGSQWKAIGHRSAGPAEGPVRDGYIEFVPVKVSNA